MRREVVTCDRCKNELNQRAYTLIVRYNNQNVSKFDDICEACFLDMKLPIEPIERANEE